MIIHADNTLEVTAFILALTNMGMFILLAIMCVPRRKKK